MASALGEGFIIVAASLEGVQGAGWLAVAEFINSYLSSPPGIAPTSQLELLSLVGFFI